ncbi:UNVERIFIED_CONTAM: hypothetical protein POZ17_10960 [Ralstonia mannitolilytica]
MKHSEFVKHINHYYPLPEETIKDLLDICTEEYYRKNDLLLESGSMARYYYFLKSGLIGY